MVIALFWLGFSFVFSCLFFFLFFFSSTLAISIRQNSGKCRTFAFDNAAAAANSMMLLNCQQLFRAQRGEERRVIPLLYWETISGPAHSALYSILSRVSNEPFVCCGISQPMPACFIQQYNGDQFNEQSNVKERKKRKNVDGGRPSH